MSDIGLFGSVYEQLREYSDKLDALLLQIRSDKEPVRAEARKQLSVLLRVVGDANNKSPAVQIVRAVLRRELAVSRPDALCSTLASALETREPSQKEIEDLDRIALAVDSERQTTMARMRGRP